MGNHKVGAVKLSSFEIHFAQFEMLIHATIHRTNPVFWKHFRRETGNEWDHGSYLINTTCFTVLSEFGGKLPSQSKREVQLSLYPTSVIASMEEVQPALWTTASFCRLLLANMWEPLCAGKFYRSMQTNVVHLHMLPTL